MSDPAPGVYHAYLDGTGGEPLLAGDYFAIALDLVGDKMYLTNTAINGGPRRADLDGSNPATILVHQTGVPVGFPMALALDTQAAHMYWADTLNDTITRANADGTEVTVFQDLSATGTASNLALDLTPGPEIPSLSEWGLATMTLLMLAAGTIVLVRRRKVCG